MGYRLLTTAARRLPFAWMLREIGRIAGRGEQHTVWEFCEFVKLILFGYLGSFCGELSQGRFEVVYYEEEEDRGADEVNDPRVFQSPGHLWDLRERDARKGPLAAGLPRGR